MSNLPFLRYRALDSNGDPYGAANLYVYEPGTTTPLTTYTEYTFTTPHDHPIVADSGGLFPEIYFTAGQKFRAILKDSSGNTIFDVDNVSPVSLDGTAIEDQVHAMAENPVNYGGVGDGASDESTEVQAAIDATAANADRLYVDLLGLTWRCDSALTIPSGVTIRNGTLNFANASGGDYLDFSGSLANGVLLTNTPAAGATSFTIASDPGITAGDWLRIDGGTDEMVQVKSLATLTVTTTDRLFFAYTASDSAQLVTMVQDAGLDNVTVIGTSAAESTVRLNYSERINIRNCHFTDTASGTHAIIECDDIVNCVFENCLFESNGGATAITMDGGAVHCFVDRCELRNGNGLITIGDTSGTGCLCVANVVTNCKIRDYDTAGIILYENTVDTVVRGIKANTSTSGTVLNLQGTHMVVSDVDSWGAATGVAIQNPNTYAITTTTTGSVIERVRMTGLATVGITIGTRTGGNDGVRFADCEFTSVDPITTTLSHAVTKLEFIRCRFSSTNGEFLIDASSATVDDLVIDGCDFSGVAVDVRGESSNEYGNNLTITGNKIYGTINTTGISVGNFRNSVISRNKIGTPAAQISQGGISLSRSGSNATQASHIITDNFVYVTGAFTGISAGAGGSIQICNNVVGLNESTALDFGIYTSLQDDEHSVVISNNVVFARGATTDGLGIWVFGANTGNPSQYVTISGNAIDATEYGVQLTGKLLYIAITGNVIKTTTATSSRGVILTGAAAAAISDVMISGNVIQCPGTYGIEGSNIQRVNADGNIVNGYITGTTNGLTAATDIVG